MVGKKLPIVWENKARQSLKDVYYYIKYRSSKSQAEKVRDHIVNLAEKIQPMPLKHSKELLLEDLSIEFRYIVAWNYKIIYEIFDNKIVIIDIFHTSRNPKDIKK
jgi:plasmid stabilization system protein ParE